MLKKDNFGFGFGICMLVTSAVYLVLYLFNNVLLKSIYGDPIFRESLLMITALGVNIFILNYYLRRNANRTAKGMMTFVFLCAAYIIYYYFAEDLGFKKSQ